MKVIKIGGGCLKDKKTIKSILELVVKRAKGDIFVVSALNGITDLLIDGMKDALENEDNIPPLMTKIKNRHMHVAKYLISSSRALKIFTNDFYTSLTRLERYYYGLNFTGEITPKVKDVISSFGERFSAELLSSALRAEGHNSTFRMPHKIGLLTDGKFGDASALLKQTEKNLKENLADTITKDSFLFIPGYFGISEMGDITTFGRGGSDYSAAVFAVALGADMLEFWKDVAGFMSADPRFVKNAQLIPKLSYEEAAELSYFGAKILHPRAVEPVRKYGMDISIKNTLDPDAKGSLISGKRTRTKGIIKSVTHNTDIGILKVYASGVGARPGILASVANTLTDDGINIKSVVTAQTCISVLVDRQDIETGYKALKKLNPNTYRQLEKVEDAALLSIVGEGQHKEKGIAAKCFSAISDAGINVEMISFGPSKVALYFIVKQTDLKKSVNAIHRIFFS